MDELTQTPPFDARAVAQAGMAALRAGEAGKARDLFEQVAASGHVDARLWLALAEARGAAGDQIGKAAAFDAALALDPRNFRALIGKADHFGQAGDVRAAASFYAAALRGAPAFAHASADEQNQIRRAKTMVDSQTRAFEVHIRDALAAEGLVEGQVNPRFLRAIDILVGKKQAYAQAPRYFYYPELAPVQFYPRADFPWLDKVEAAFESVRDELRAVIAQAGAFAPYVEPDPKRPHNTQRGMAGNPDWSAYFLCKEGVLTPGAAACPNTLAALAEAPLTRIPNRAPAVLFSRLAAGARIPAHTGMLNARLICHLPLIVPPDCVFRVGNEQRNWEEGKAWVFDDSIEHEAWNRSRQDRYVLIFDIWRPDIGEDERRAISALCRAVDGYGGQGAWDA